MYLRNSNFLGFVHRHRYWLTWMVTFVIFVLLSVRRIDLLSSFFISLTSILPMILLSEVLRHVLIPRLLHRNRLAYYMLSIVTVMLLTFFAIEGEIATFHLLTDNGLFDVSEQVATDLASARDSGYFFLHLKFTFLLLVTLAIVTISRLLDERQELEHQMHEATLQNELRLLRAQINPHFLFNALNCIYTLTLMQDSEAPDSVLKLSDMLRYVIDDCRGTSVPLRKEVEYIQNYIAFQRIRMEREPDITFSLRLADADAPVPPMLLQPIVENCFKHSRIIDDVSAFIHIDLVQTADGTLDLTTHNSKHLAPASSLGTFSDQERQGIGLNNVRQHLQLLFGSRATLTHSEDAATYTTRLTIKG